MAKKNRRSEQYPHIPRPIRRVVVQTNGDLAIIQDVNNTYWLVNRVHGRTYPDEFSLLDQAKREAASVSFIADPSSPSPKWKEKKR